MSKKIKMKIKKSQLIKLIKEQISKNELQEYQIDFLKGKFHYQSFGPGHYTWENFWTAPVKDPQDFGSFKSVQAAKKAFLQKYPREQNYYLHTENAARLLKNGKPIFGTGNGQLFKK